MFDIELKIIIYQLFIYIFI